MTGVEPLIIRAIAVTIFRSLWEGGGKVLGSFSKTLDDKSRQLIFQASGQYDTNYRERHGILKVLGMREPKPLESVYTAVQFLGEEEIQRLESVEALESAYRKAKHRSFEGKKQNKRSGLEVANEKQFFMVLGGPDAGKSTFLRRVGLEALKGKKGKFKHRCIPVFIELKEFRSHNINIEEKIATEFRICGFPDPEKFTKRAREQGKLLILRAPRYKGASVRGKSFRHAQPTGAIIDSQSVKTTDVGGGEGGFDGGQKVNGRKRHILVDTLGLVLVVIVHAANMADVTAGGMLLAAFSVAVTLPKILA